MVAVAHGYLPHNIYSQHRRYAWGGLVAVAESQRGKGLGNYINALMAVSVFRNLGATCTSGCFANAKRRRLIKAAGAVDVAAQ
jgi:hypothetical protein